MILLLHSDDVTVGLDVLITVIRRQFDCRDLCALTEFSLVLDSMYYTTPRGVQERASV